MLNRSSPVRLANNRISSLALCVALMLAASVRLLAVPYLMEGFNYPAGNLGANSPWVASSPLIAVSDAGLTYPYLVNFSPARSVNVFEGTKTVTYRPLQTPATNGCVYFSFLITFPAVPGSYYIAGLTQHTNASPGGAAADPLDLIDGYYGTNGYTLGVRAMGGSANYVTNGFTELYTNIPYLVVLKYNFTNGAASLYLNPPAGNTEPALPDAISYSLANETVPDLSDVYLRNGSSTAGDFTIGSLRAASTWAEVTPATNAAAGYSQAAMLANFLQSLQVENYWIEGFSVNWLTGATNGSGPNMTEGTDTHCSAFAGAVTDLLGIYLLRQPYASDILLANNQARWLATNTAGWYPVPTMTMAQHLVNTGALVVASWENPDSNEPGHIAVLLPCNRTDASINTFGPEECESGTFNYADTNVSTGFDTPGQFPGEILYYSHAVTYPINTVNPAFGLSSVSNQNFVATFPSIVGRKYQVQWSTNLTQWTPLTTFTNANNSTYFYTNTTVRDPVSGFRYYQILAW